MRVFVCAVVFLCGLLFFASYAQAADPVAAAVQKRYAGIGGMKAEFTQVLVHKESGGKDERKGILYFVKPLHVRWETTNPIPELLIVTPQALWNVFPDEDMAYKYPPELSEDSGSIVRVVTGQSDLEKDFIIENKGAKQGVASLVLYPKNPSQSMTEVELSVEAATGTIRQVTIVDFFNNRNTITFTSQVVDPKLDETLFTFAPPKGMKVEDRTKDGPANTPLLR